MWRHVVIYLAFNAVNLIYSSSDAASFPCSKASTLVEKLVCADPSLSSMDEDMANLYRQSVSYAEFPEKIRREQREWLNGDRNSCRSKKCLMIAYAVRIEALQSESNQKSSSTGEAFSRSQHFSKSDYQARESSSTDEILLIQNNQGVYEVPVIVNNVLKINFIIDSGAADVSISPDVALTLLKTGTIGQNDWLPGKHYTFADGSSTKSTRFNIQSMMLGNHILRDVVCRIDDNIEAPMLLGQSALTKLGSYQIDYRRGTLIFR